MRRPVRTSRIGLSLEYTSTESITDSFVGVDNYEGESSRYTVVSLEQELADDGTVADERERDRLEVDVDDGDTALVGDGLELTDGEFRFVWLLYPDGFPTIPLSTPRPLAFR